ncbi:MULTISPECIES: TatD family hydrolase [unclassified Leeuwenhoekiella]|uniref:TatD family hydrolase n=1 Tax=unclassified Leeuwenhoekiella TaxID=2615029 RepID=UPI000C6487AD|nr:MULTISPECIES: TatD family hydrolase [unclassified Leeuwenhoekiella]MAW96336.1 hydrolase TatD [Leeuwenhoekiella sp.]MBA81223.1 hydrolase TatD [Leeuwenhoekiella sp.]|tara:strand:- start:2317 stop:3099 length:783 start_codon:yes stop_codon:yes gene_type:complete
MFIDTHTHLYSESFKEDRNEMIQRAFEASVKNFVLPAIDSTYTSAMWELKNQYPESMHLMAGLHPTHVDPENIKVEMEHVKEELASKTYCAVGEIGIDLYWDRSTEDLQKEIFAEQIRLAKQYDLPIVIHCRDAFDEVFEVLEAEKSDALRGIFHCFTGNQEHAQKAIDLNLLLGIGGVVTFKNGKIDQFIHEIDLDHIVLETDAPYLAPAPFRGKRNESSYLIQVAKKLSELYGVPLEHIEQQTTNNAKKLFGLDSSPK